MTVTDGQTGDLYYDPFDYEVDANAQAIWKRMRDEAPVYWNEKYEFFALSRYDDVLEAMIDARRFRSSHGTTIDSMGPEPVGFSIMIFMDPPAHTWHRKLVSRAFTPKAITALEPRITRLCNDLLDKVDGRSEWDFIESYGAVIPPTVILALMGFPEGFEEEWQREVNASLSRPSEGGGAGPMTMDQSMGELIDAEGGMGAGALFQLLPGLIEERRREPKEDLMSVLVNSDLNEDGVIRKLTDEEIFGFVLLLSAAGTETVARFLGWAGSLLDENPDQRDKLVKTPELIPNAVEEILRYEAPSPVNGRIVYEDAEFQGITVPKGSRLLMLNGAANRDDRHFPDADRFDVDRRIDRHFSFGNGAHFCVGAALARMEAHIAIREMLKRHPTWEVLRDGTEMVHTSTVRGFSKLPIRV
jgi:cytochrome P450